MLALCRVLPNGQRAALGLQRWGTSTLHSSGQSTTLPIIVPPIPSPEFRRHLHLLLTLRPVNKLYPSRPSW